MIIHGSALSPFRRKVVLSAMEKNIAFESRDLNPYAPPVDFESMNPLKRIPIVQDGDFTLADSSAICGYFEAKHADTQALFPKEPTAYGHALWIEEYADTALFADISEGVFRPIFINQLLGKPVDHATVEETLSVALPLRLRYLESQLEDRTWFAGDSLTVADLSVYSQLVNLLHAGHLPSSESYPYLMAHFKRIQTRPSAEKLHRSETAYLGQMLEMISSRKG
ncbi:MAG: glutathione S-transferase [Rhodobiaceae bacterium]|nr:MAG: glutathione S-transferase [Rhodobiaceae bacterium]